MNNTSPQKRSSVVPVGHMLGHNFLSLARSHLPVLNKPQPRTHRRRAFLGVAPVPFAPLVDAHAFQPPPPPYSARPDDVDAGAQYLPVPHNTPEGPTAGHSGSTYTRSIGIGTGVGVGLGLEGVEKGDGARFDGLGRLSGGFRPSLGGGSTSRDALREHVHRMLTECSRRRRTRASERPATQHDVFYASVEVEACDVVASSMPAGTVKIRIRRKSAASPTPGARRWEGVRRGTISSELKRAASLERRALLWEATHTTPWRV